MLISRKIGLLVVIAMVTCAAVSSFGLFGPESCSVQHE